MSFHESVWEDRLLRAEIVVKGVVQGVGFRPFIYRTAVANQVFGYVRNRGDAGVEIIIEGNADNIRNFVSDLKTKKPSLSQIYDISLDYSHDKNKFERFSIYKSFAGGNLTGSVIPYDVSICEKCLEELRSPSNRRHDYFFITCTECGPRYTIIERPPYDRINTTMRDFPMCEECKEEYTNPLDRRFHAQTIACKKCGPKAFLTDNHGKLILVDDPIREGGKLIEEGSIVAIKGNGGFHIACSTTRSEPLTRLRTVKHRAQKPFAIMTRDWKTIKSFAVANNVETDLLMSEARPIVLLNKNSHYGLSELIAPALYNIGVMLPYTGLHYMLFDQVKEPAFVMTSANPPSEPIVKDNTEALEKLGQVVDFFLFHNRNIAQRCDDSVIRVHNDQKSIIRRSRGYAPSPLHLKNPVKNSTLGLGAEENVNSCLLLADRAFISQYVGDVEKLETLRFLEAATRHLLEVTKIPVSAIGCDLHPLFSTTRLAQEFGVEFRCPVFQVQHHYAHLLSLLAEHGKSESVGIVCDGTGYGPDGTIWGGEILHCTLEGFSRLGHLQAQPMIGGDLAAKYPLRMATAILNKVMDPSDWILAQTSHFPHGEKEVKILLQQLKNDQLPLTSSCGRVLDAIAALLGICYERTYEGEAAVKLESLASQGKDVLKLHPQIKRSIIDTSYLLQELFENRNKQVVPDLACSAEAYLAKSLAELAVDEAREMGVNTVGFSGGVAYNGHFTSIIQRIVEENKLTFLFHNQIPPGDGGISLGQAVAASNFLSIR